MTWSPQQLIGKELGNYHIREILGQGSMGVVFLAEQQSLNRKVALKVLDARFSSDQNYIERFKREARSAASLLHTNIVQVYDVGEEGGVYYIAIEYIDGESLQRIIDTQGKLSPQRVLDIALQAAKGLARAHGENIIHRDIKPDNLMFNTHNELKIADFGLARNTREQSSLTTDHSIVGTPYYMSPEQGKGEEVDNRSDLYSLGSTMYHLLTGHPPFEASTFMGVILKNISLPPTAPNQVTDNVPDKLNNIILKLLAKDREDRFNSANDLADALQSDTPIPLPKIEKTLTEQKPTNKKHKKNNYGNSPPHSESTISSEIHTEVGISTVEGVSEAIPEHYRLFKRIPLNIVASFSPSKMKKSQRDEIHASIGNLSKGGIFLTTIEPYPIGTVIDISFTLPNRDLPLESKCIVRWKSNDVASPGVGLQFINTSTSGNTTITSFIQAESNNSTFDISTLAKSFIDKRLMRLCYMELDSTLSIQRVANLLGTSQHLVARHLKVFEKVGLVLLINNSVSFCASRNPALLHDLEDWVLENSDLA